MIDIGVNLTNDRFERDLPSVIERSQQVGVTGLIITGTNLEESQKAVSLANQWSGYCYSTAGVHPHDAKSITDLSFPELRVLAKNACVVAIGECGLDFNRDFSPRDQQEAVFEAQLALAVDLQLPVFLHCRDAHDRFLSILKPYQDRLVGAVLHCFTGTKEELLACLEVGLHIGVTGWICDERRGQTLRDIVRFIPDDKLMIETDSPYLLPRDLRPKPKSSRNEPCYLPHIAQVIAECREQSANTVIENSRRVSDAFFSLNQ